MFKIIHEPTFSHEVVVNAPVNGAFEKQTFTATFKALSLTRVADFDFGVGAQVTDFLRTVVVGISDVVSEDGQPLPDDQESRELLFGIPYVRTPIISAYFDGVSGAQRGN